MNKKIYLYNYRNEFLIENKYINYKEINTLDFFNFLFKREDKLPFQNKDSLGDFTDGRYNSICVEIDNKNKEHRNYIVTKDLKVLEELKNKDFVIVSPITYIGRNRNSNNARYLYGLAFDIDGVEEKHLIDILYRGKKNYIPLPNIIVNSGNGVHLYYLFEKPIALFNNIKPLLKHLKYELTDYLWNGYTSAIEERQYQGIFQGFRVPGTKTKFGTEVKAFYNEETPYYSIRKLNEYVQDESKRDIRKLSEEQITMIEKAEYKKNRISKAQAKELYPDWYERRIVKGENRKRWNIKRDLYDWWLNKKLKEEKNTIKAGHRYFCIMTLAMFAIKCNISYEELKKDAYSLFDIMEDKTENSDNHFTEEDIEDALKAYLENYITFPRKDIEKITGYSIPANKRNFRKQEIHLKIMNSTRDILYPAGEWRNKEGRPKGSGIKKEIVKEWREKNPSGKKIDCIKETNLSKPTVYKYWEA